jgi:molybdate transport system ATP-binding protein
MGANDIDPTFALDWPGFRLDVDVTLPGVGVTALFGASGSGKTTLLRLLAGLERAPKGRLSFKGDIWQDESTWLPPHRRPLGYVFQEASLFPHLTVMGNLEYGRRRAKGRQPVELGPVIELLGIGSLLHRTPSLLSGGERQRVGIARALAVGPRILLMDEPLAALDLERKKEILPYLERLHEELEIPLVYVSHSPDEVARLADYLVAMEKGRVVSHGPLGEVLARVDLPMRLAEDAGVVLDGAVGERDERWHLARVDFAGGSLWTRDHGLAVGHRVRVRVLARDVSLAVESPGRTSITNSLEGVVDAIAAEEHPGLALVRVRVGESALVARLTQRSVAMLGLSRGRPVWVQVKSVALMK